MSLEVALFDTSFISPQVQAALPEGYTLRPLRANDYERGFLKVLEVLTEVGNQTKEEWMGKGSYSSFSSSKGCCLTAEHIHRTLQLS